MPFLRLFLACLLIPILPGAAHTWASPTAAENLIRSHLEPSTATFQQTTWNLPGSHLGDDSAAYSVEASIAPSFNLVTVHHGGTWMLDILPKFVVRRADALGSNPVRTPTYEPTATLYYAPVDSLGPHQPAWYASAFLLHYSNGQSGSFLREDGRTLNNVDGSFSLWSVGFGLHWVNDWPVLPAYKSVRVAWLYNKEGLLDETYPDLTVSVNLETREQLHEGWFGWGGRSRWLADFEWLPRNPSDRPADLKPAPFAGSLTAVFSPARTRNPASVNPGFSVFARYYAGYDPYNMNFNREIYRIDAGLMFLPR